MASKHKPTPTDASLTDLEGEKEVAVQSLPPPSEFTYVYLRVVFCHFSSLIKESLESCLTVLGAFAGIFSYPL